MTEGVQGDKAGSKSPEDATAVIQTHKGTLQHPLTPHAVLAFFTELNITHSPHAVIFILQNQCPVEWLTPDHTHVSILALVSQIPDVPVLSNLPRTCSYLSSSPSQSRIGEGDCQTSANSMQGVAAMISHQR